MSWAAEEWKDGLPQKALVKINQIESQLERFKKERDQKQFQLESLEQAFEVQKRKGGNEKTEIAALKRENESLAETCQLLKKEKEKLTSDLLLKEKRVISQEQKTIEVNSQEDSEKSNGLPAYQQEAGSHVQNQTITSLEQEIAELRKQLKKESDESNHTSKRGPGEELSCTKSLRHPTEEDELRKTQQELQALRSLVSEVELKNKKLIQEGECARHNAEAARQHLELRMKESEKELKRELAQALEKTKNAERVLLESKSKWQQELTAAQTEHVKLQGLIDKLEADKASLIRELDDASKKVAAADAVVKSSLADVAVMEKRKTALEDEKQKLLSEMSQKNEEFQATCADILKLKSDIALRDQANDSMKGQLMDKTLDLDRIQAEADKMSQKFLQAENQLMDLQKQKLKAEEHLRDISMTLNQLQNDKERLEKSNTDLTKQMYEMREEVEMLSVSLKNTQAQMTEADSNFKESLHKWKDLENTLRCELDHSLLSVAQMTDLKNQMDIQISSKDGNIQELLNQIKANQDIISINDSDISQRDQNITELEKQLQTLQNQHDSLQCELSSKDREVLELMNQIKASQDKISIKNSDISQRDQNITELEKQLQTLQGQNDSLQCELSSKDREVLELMNQIKASQDKVTSKNSEISQRDQNITELEKQLQTLQGQHDSLQKELQQQQMSSLKEMAIVEDALRNKSEELEIIATKYSQEKVGFETEFEQMLNQKSLIESEMKSIKTECENGKNMIASLNGEIEALKAELKAKTSDFLEMDSVIQNQQKELQKKTEVNAALSSELSQRDQHINLVKDSLSAVEIELEKSQNELKYIGEKCEKLESEKASLIPEIVEFKKQIECGVQDKELYQKEMKELQQQLEILKSECLSLSSQTNVEQEKRALQEKEISNLHNKCHELEVTIMDYKTGLDDKSVAIIKLEEQCKQLTDSLDKEQAESRINLNKLNTLDIQLSELNKLHKEVVDELTYKLSDAMKCSEELKSLLESKDNRVIELNAEIMRLKNDALNLETLCTSLKDELEQKTDFIVTLEDKCALLSVELTGAEQKISEKEELLSTNLENHSHLESQVMQLEEEKETLEVSNKELHLIQEQLHQQLGKLKEKDAKILALEDDKEEISIKLTEALQVAAESDKKHVLEMSVQKTKLEMMQTDIEDMDGSSQDLNVKILNLTSMLENMTQERNNLQKTSQLMCVEADEMKSALETEKSYLEQLKHELCELKERNRNLEITLVNTQSDLDGKNTILTERDACLENAQMMILEYKKELLEHEDEKHQLVQQINDLQQTVTAGVESEATKTQEIERLSKNCTLLSDSLQTVTEQLSEHKMEINFKDQSIHALELKLKELERDSLQYQEKVQKELEDLHSQVAQRDVTLEQMVVRRGELENSNENLRCQLLEVECLKSEKGAQREQEIAAMKSQVELLEMDVEDKDKVILKLRTEISNLQSQVELMSQEKVKMNETETCLESELMGLKSALDEEREKAAHVKMNEETLNERINNLESALSEARVECEQREKCLQDLKSECENIAKVNTEYERKSIQLQEEKEKFVARIEDLQAHLNLERQTIEDKTSDLDTVTQQCAEISENLVNLKEELLHCQEELVTKTEKLSQTECELKQKELEMIEIKDVSSKDLDQLQRNLNERDEQLSWSASKIKDLENFTTDLKENLKDSLSRKSVEGAQHEQEIAAMKSQVELLEMDVEDKDKVILELRTEISNLQSQVELMSQEKVKMNETETCLESELMGLKSALDEEREKAAHVKMNEETLNERINNLESALSEARVECEQREKCLQDLQSECESIRGTIKKYEESVKESQNENDKLIEMFNNQQDISDSNKEMIEGKMPELDTFNNECATSLDNDQTLEELNNKEQKNFVVEDKELEGEIKQDQAPLVQSEETLREKSFRISDLESWSKDLKVKHSEKSVHNEEEESMLKSSLDTTLVDKHDTLNVNDLKTKLTNLLVTVENLTKDRVSLEENFNSTQTELLSLKVDLNTERESHADTKKFIERQLWNVEILETSLAKARILLLRQESNFNNLNHEQSLQSSSSKQTDMQECDQNLHKSYPISALERLVSSTQEIANYIVSEAEALSSYCTELHEKLATARIEASSTKEQLHNLGQSFQLMEAKYQQLVLDKKYIEETLNKDIDELKELLHKKNEDMQTTSQLQASLVQDKPSGTNVEDETYSMKDSTELDELRSNIEHKDEIINMINDEVTNNVSKSCSTNEEYDKVKDAVSELQHSLLENSHGILIEEPPTDTQILKKTITDLEKQLAEVIDLLKLKEQHILNSECELKLALDSSEDLKLSINQKVDQISDLETSVKYLKQQQELICSEKSDIEKCFSQDIEALRLQVSTVQEKLESESNDLVNAETQNDDLNKSMSELNLRLAELQADKIAAYEQLDEVRKLLTEATSDLHNKDGTNCILREELDDALHENDAMKMEKVDWHMREEKYKQDINDLEVKLTDLNTEIESTRESFECLSDQRFEAQTKLQNVLMEKKDLENKLMNITTEAKKCSENLQDMKVELDSLKQKVIAKDDEILNLKTQVEELTSSEKSELFELDLLRQRKEDVERDFNEVRTRNKDLEEQLYDFTAVTKEMKEQLAQLQDLIQTLNKNIERKKKELVQRINEISKKDDEICHLKAAVSDTEKANTELSKQITNIQKENNSTIGTLQDAIESLNYELADADKEKSSFISENGLLKTENLKLNERLKTLMNEVQRQQNGENITSMELKTRITDLEKVNAEFIIQISFLEKDNKELKIVIEEKTKHACDLSVEVKSLNEQLQKIACDNLSLEIDILKVENDSLHKQLEEKNTQLCCSKETEKSLSVNVSDMENRISVLQIELDSAKERIIILGDENEKFTLQCEKFENENSSLKEAAVIVRESLNKQVEVLEKVTTEKHELEKMVREYDLVVLEKDQLLERVQTLKFVEVDKQKLEEKFEHELNEKSILIKKVQELEVVLNDKENINKWLNEVKLEKAALLEEVKVLQLNNSRLDTCIKENDQQIKDLTFEKASLQEMNKKIEFDNSHLEENVKDLNQRLKNVVFENNSLQEVMKKMESNKNQLEKKLKELDLMINGLTFEKGSLQDVMKNLESNNSHLEMKVKEMETLVSEHNVLKENIEEQKRTLEVKTIELHHVMAEKSELENKLKEFQILKDELEEVKQEREEYKEKYMNMSEAGQKQLARSKELQRHNEKLTSRNKLLHALLKGEKPMKIEPIIATNFIPEFKTQKLQSEPSTEIAQSSTNLPCKDKVESAMCVRFDLGSNVTSSISYITNVNAHDALKNKNNSTGIKEQFSSTNDEQNPDGANVIAGFTGTNSQSCSPRLRHNSPKLQAAQKLKISTLASNSSPKLVQSNSKIATPKPHFTPKSVQSTQKHKQEIPSKIVTPRSALKIHKLKESKVLKMTASPSRHSNVSKLLDCSNGPIKMLPLPAVNTSDRLRIIPSPRTTRLVSRQKRRSAEQSNDMAGGKKSKLLVKETLTETPMECENKNSLQHTKLPQPVQSKYVRPLRQIKTRSKKETVVEENALATITNSPRKVPETRGSRRARIQANSLQLTEESTNEGPSDCKVN